MLFSLLMFQLMLWLLLLLLLVKVQLIVVLRNFVVFFTDSVVAVIGSLLFVCNKMNLKKRERKYKIKKLRSMLRSFAHKGTSITHPLFMGCKKHIYMGLFDGIVVNKFCFIRLLFLRTSIFIYS